MAKRKSERNAIQKKSSIDRSNKKGNSKAEPRCLAIAKRGIQTGGEFAEMMSALMSDLVEGKITPRIANATVSAGSKLLKMVELQLKYGGGKPEDKDKSLKLIPCTRGK